MFGKSKKKASPPRVERIPDGFTADMITVESSICTGERTIGFYDPATKSLKYAELVKSDGDIAAFYSKYGVE